MGLSRPVGQLNTLARKQQHHSRSHTAAFLSETVAFYIAHLLILCLNKCKVSELCRYGRRDGGEYLILVMPLPAFKVTIV